MAGTTNSIVAEVAGSRLMIGLDKGHRLEIRQNGSETAVVESRPVMEFAVAVDALGKLHIAAWLLSRHLMYYTSMDGRMFTHSTLLKGDGTLRLKDCLIHSGTAVSVAYVAENDDTDTLVCYRYMQGEWQGKRVVQTEHPQRLTAYQFDGPPDAPHIVYGVREQNRTTVLSRPAASDEAPETIASSMGGLTDICVLTVGGARQSCWISDGYIIVNGMRQSEEPWTCAFPHLKRDDSGVQCLWMENELLSGIVLGAQRARLRPAAVNEALPCLLALPGEIRRAVVNGKTLQEVKLLREVQERVKAVGSGAQTPVDGRQDLTLTDVVRNQAIYLTRMQDSLGGMERNVLRLQAEVNRLSREVASLLRDRAEMPKPARQVSLPVDAPKKAPEAVLESQAETAKEQVMTAAEE